MEIFDSFKQRKESHALFPALENDVSHDQLLGVLGQHVSSGDDLMVDRYRGKLKREGQYFS